LLSMDVSFRTDRPPERIMNRFYTNNLNRYQAFFQRKCTSMLGNIRGIA